MGVDIAVNLNGHTLGARTAVFALRAAPIQVNYLGFPGTMGADYMDYIIGDRTVIPPGHFCGYAERVVWLPDSFQVNDDGKAIAEREFSRKEFGLPESAFVFCCFNATYKITPDTFAAWMRLLEKVPGSVLWLVGAVAAVERNLRREAEKRGIAPERIIFAGRLGLPEHLQAASTH